MRPCVHCTREITHCSCPGCGHYWLHTVNGLHSCNPSGKGAPYAEPR